MTKRSNKTRSASNLRSLHAVRIYSFGVLLISLLIIQGIATLQTGATNRQTTPQHNEEVLAYATSISIPDLYAATNQARATNGLGPLALNARLNSGAQAKANDMIAKDYWSHNAPDGTQPWAFFVGAGYAYNRAAENLAYGFDTSGGVVNGWMNSPGHRANIVGPYQEIGFGIANGPAYQGGPNTVIVAFYGTPQAPVAAMPAAPPPKPAPVASVPKPPTVSTSIPTPQATTPAEATPAPTAMPPILTQPTPDWNTAAEEPKKITNLETALQGQSNWAIYASLSAVGVTSMGFVTTHFKLIRRGWKQSKHYILVHPALDTAVLAAITAIILTSTAGFIK